MAKETISFDSPYSDNVIEAEVKMKGNIVELRRISPDEDSSSEHIVRILTFDPEKLKAFQAIKLKDIDMEFIPTKYPNSVKWDRNNVFSSLKLRLKEIFLTEAEY